MEQLPSFDVADVQRAVSMEQAIDALRDAFAAGPEHIERSTVPVAGGELMIMPAVDDRAAGVKLLMIQPANAGRGLPVIQGTYVLFDAQAGRPIGLIDGAALTSLRTPAASAVATDALARSDARSLGIVGSGPQAIAHVRAILVVRPLIDEIVVSSRTAANAQAAAAAIAASLPAVVVRTGSPADAGRCGIVCTLTPSTEALLDASMVAAGTHINAVGAYRTDMRELAADLVAASTVVVDEARAARAEAGDLTRAIDEGAWSWDLLAGDLVDVCSGRLARRDVGEITVFKSVGLAVEDLVIAGLVARSVNLM